MWIPSHIGIKGNTMAHDLAKEAVDKLVDPYHLIPPSDLKPDVNAYIEGLWQSEWDKEKENNKLYEILPKLKDRNKLKGKTKNRKEETILSRLHIGHSWVSHSFILRREERPRCFACDTDFTVKHFLIDCSDLIDQRKNFYEERNLQDLFTNVETEKIFGFLKETGLFYKVKNSTCLRENLSYVLANL